MKLPLSSVERQTARQGIIGKTKKQGPLLFCTVMPVTVKTTRYSSTCIAKMTEISFETKRGSKM